MCPTAVARIQVQTRARTRYLMPEFKIWPGTLPQRQVSANSDTTEDRRSRSGPEAWPLTGRTNAVYSVCRLDRGRAMKRAATILPLAGLLMLADMDPAPAENRRFGMWELVCPPVAGSQSAAPTGTSGRWRSGCGQR